MDENTKAKFEEKLKELLNIAKKKRMYWNIRKSLISLTIFRWRTTSLIRL